jgi:TRAP-type mannitol/chloroaromatic compound transport system permease small subunit
MQIVKGLQKGIGWLVEWTGRTFAWLILSLIAVIVYDVFARYLFNRPTNWSFDIAWMQGTCLFTIGLSYVHLHKQDIRVEVFSRLFPKKVGAVMNLICRIFFFLPLAIMYVITGFNKAIWSVGAHEIAPFGIWHPSMIPYRFIVLLAFSLLTLIGLSRFIDELRALAGKEKL